MRGGEEWVFFFLGGEVECFLGSFVQKTGNIVGQIMLKIQSADLMAVV